MASTTFYNSTAAVFLGDYSFNTGTLKQFTPLDYAIFAAILVVSAGIGFYFAWTDRKQKDVDDFLLAGRNMSPYPVALSLLASFMSAITLLGTPAEIYNYTTMYFWIGLGYIVMIAGASHIYIPVFYRLGVTSAYEYLEKRFSRGVRTCASMTFVLQMTLYMAIVLYAPSLALNAVTGFTLWGSIISVGIVCTLYTALGGMKAVLWTDSFQIIMMIISLVTILVKAAVVVGGWDAAWESGLRTNRILFTDFRVDPSVRHSMWALTLGGYFTWVAIFGVNQAQVQRAVTCPTLKKAQLALWLNMPGLWVVLYLNCLIGVFMAAFYEKCDPLKAKFVDDANQIMPMFVMDVLGDITGLPGLFVAGLFSGALSTISSGLNSISACVLEDVIRTYFKSYMRENRARLVSQILALIFGVLCLALTYVASKLGNILQAALALFGMVGGPLLGVFSLGMFCPWANKWGAYCGLFSSLILMFWIGIGAHISAIPQEKAITSIEYCNLTAFGNETVAAILAPKVEEVSVERSILYPLYTLSYMWYSLTAVINCMVVGLVVSAVTGLTNPKDLDPRVICPLFDIIFPFLPERIRRPLRFGVNHEKENTKEEENETLATVKDKDNATGQDKSCVLKSVTEFGDKDNGYVLKPVTEFGDKDNGYVLKPVTEFGNKDKSEHAYDNLAATN